MLFHHDAFGAVCNRRILKLCEYSIEMQCGTAVLSFFFWKRIDDRRRENIRSVKSNLEQVKLLTSASPMMLYYLCCLRALCLNCNKFYQQGLVDGQIVSFFIEDYRKLIAIGSIGLNVKEKCNLFLLIFYIRSFN